MTRAAHLTLILLALACVAVARAGESLYELDKRIAAQHQRCQDLYIDALDAHSEWVGMFNDWSQGWPMMMDQHGYAKLMQRQWRKYDKVQRLWMRETAKLVDLYAEHWALTRAKP